MMPVKVQTNVKPKLRVKMKRNLNYNSRNYISTTDNMCPTVTMTLLRSISTMTSVNVKDLAAEVVCPLQR